MADKRLSSPDIPVFGTIDSTDLIYGVKDPGGANTQGKYERSLIDARYIVKTGDTMSGQLNFSGTDHAGLKLLSLTTAERDALTPAAGMLIYNETASEAQIYTSSWGSVGGGAVDSVFGRVGAVVAAGGDYTASEVTNVAAGSIVATDVQAAINELDVAKQPIDANLTAIAALTPTDGNFIVGNGSAWVAESGATARTSLGVDAAGTDNSTDVTLAGTGTYLSLGAGQILTVDPLTESDISDLGSYLPLAGGTLTGPLTVDTSSTTALLVKDDGVNDNTLLVNTFTPLVTINSDLIVSTTTGAVSLDMTATAGGENADFKFNDGATLGFQFLAAFGNSLGNRYGGFVAYEDKDANELPLWFFTQDAGGTVRAAMRIEAGQTATESAPVRILKSLSLGSDSTPGYLLDAYDAAGEATIFLRSPTNTATQLRLVEGDHFQGGYIRYDGSTNDLYIGTHDAADTNLGNDKYAIRIPRNTTRVGINVDPTAQLHVNQSSATAAIPPLKVVQADLSEEMMELDGTTIGIGNAIEAVGAKTLTTTHFVKVTITGVGTRYIPVGTIA